MPRRATVAARPRIHIQEASLKIQPLCTPSLSKTPVRGNTSEFVVSASILMNKIDESKRNRRRQTGLDISQRDTESEAEQDILARQTFSRIPMPRSQGFGIFSTLVLTESVPQQRLSSSFFHSPLLILIPVWKVMKWTQSIKMFWPKKQRRSTGRAEVLVRADEPISLS